MAEFLDDVRRRNTEWASGLGEVPAGVPARAAAVVTCMDCRIDVLGAFGLQVGDAHVVRNAGAMATDDVERSLVLSQYDLGTRTILVVGHTNCGLVGVDEAAIADTVEQARGSRPAYPIGSHASPEDGVRATVRALRASPHLAHTDDVHGFVYDVDTGHLTPVP